MTFKVPAPLLNLETPPQFDNDTSPATTEFVQRALGNIQDRMQVSVNTTLTALDCGKEILPTTTGLTITLPLSTALPFGSMMYVSGNNKGITIAVQGADVFTRPDASAGSITLNTIDYAILRKTGTGWGLMYGPAALKYMTDFSASMSGNGYQKLPSGLIMQWGIITEASHNNEFDFGSVTLPITFPNSALFATGQIYSSLQSTSNGDTFALLHALSTSSVWFYGVSGNVGTATYGLRWFAIGY